MILRVEGVVKEWISKYKRAQEYLQAGDVNSLAFAVANVPGDKKAKNQSSACLPEAGMAHNHR